MRTFGTGERIAVGVALVAAAVLFFGGSIWNFITGSGASNAQYQASVESAAQGAASTTPAGAAQTSKIMQNISKIKGLEIYDEQVGDGAVAKAGQTVTAHYIGLLTNGTKFDSSVDRGQPFSFKLGTGQVIKGWDLGIAGMKVGGIRRLVISPELAYGSQVMGPIPANSTLIFEVQLLNVK
jgi:FKBP-type peptidyl-prolyl cis-trans isomerase